MSAMSSELEGLLRTLLADSSKMGALTPEQVQRLVASLRAAVGVQPQVPPDSPNVASVPAWSEGALLTIDEAAAQLRVSPRWLYRHAKTLPFTRKLSRKMLRFSQAGLARWLATRRT
jgi:predicted DNA-binding transcriptional regulator AlpA